MFKNKKAQAEIPQPQTTGSEAIGQLSPREVVDRFALISKNGELALMTLDATYRPTTAKGHSIDLRNRRNNPVRHFVIEQSDGSMSHMIVDEAHGSYTMRWTEPGEFDEKGKPILHELEKPGDFSNFNRNSSVFIHVPQGAIAKEFSERTRYIEEKNIGVPVVDPTDIVEIKQQGLYEEFTMLERMARLEEGLTSAEPSHASMQATAHFAGRLALE